MNTLIINPPFLEPYRPPISCAILAEVSKQEGHNVEVLDLNIDLYRKVGSKSFSDYKNEYFFGSNTELKNKVHSLVVNILLNHMKDKKYDWILISCFGDWEYPITEYLCKILKSKTSAKIVGGGPGLDKFGLLLVEDNILDFHVKGEGEIALKKLFQGETSYPGINGIPPKQIDDIENLPVPTYDYFDLSKYEWLLDDPDFFIYGSRGCVRHCTFCNIELYWPKFRYRSGASIANEMIKNYEQYGVKNYYFTDSLLNGNLKEFRSFLDIMSKYKYGREFRWGGYAIVRPKSQHPKELWDQMEAGGGSFMVVGIESGVDRIREDMKKKFTNDDIDWHLEQSQRIGLQNNFLLISSWYNETYDEHLEYLKMFSRWQRYAADGTPLRIKGIATAVILIKEQGE